MVYDTLATSAAFPLALMLRLDVAGMEAQTMAVAITMAILIVASPPVYRVLGLHRGLWRYTSVVDLLRVVRAAGLLALVVFGLQFLVDRLETIPRSVPILFLFMSIVLLAGPRSALATAGWRSGF